MKITAVLFATALALSTAGCGGDNEAQAQPPTPLSITGVLKLTSARSFSWDSSTNTCAGKGGYDDLRTGAQVVVTDAQGTTAALGSVITSQAIYAGQALGEQTFATSCELTFLVKDVPPGKGFYGVEVAHRGRLQYPESKLAEPLTFGF